ncbi:MAG: hypothetical protein A3G30_06160 [Chlamydiae bacterium RIFCSPLOWO2_12_FULL_49_12]|nr:MAG: hypothetical protein A3I15_02940 [Chlamydiae bacterium RIFCSPLOWO2_02_FULL_49_12]OGN70912.1 MAG: hypothetical protein A3G30_06160 [Chlamydiae bacterium RIFCSPLOWO2_12_FULL_49_12]
MPGKERIRVEWEVLDTGKRSAEENMAFDERLLLDLTNRRSPVIHFYDWEKKSATYGYFLKPRELLKMERIESRGIELARRPTGGGIVFHLWDFAFSVLVPARSSLYSQNTLHNYALINRAVLAAVKQFLQGSVLPELALQKLSSSCSGFCMARPTKYDVVVAGKKVAGAAQRKTKGGFLHQGTIALTLPDFELLEELLPEGSLLPHAIFSSTFPLLQSKNAAKEKGEVRRELKELLTNAFMRMT